MIAIYTSSLTGSLPYQTFSIQEPITLYEWLHTVKSQCWNWIIFGGRDIALDKPQQFTAQVNGRVLTQNEWQSTSLNPDDAVALTFEPKGGIVGDIFSFVGNTVQSVFGLFFNTPSLPNTSSAREQGDELDQATFDTNQAKLNKVIPECFGRVWRTPDLLVQTHQRFENNEQVSYLHLCCGVGHYRIEDILIGNTAIGSFGSDAQYRIYGPSENHDGFTPTENWYTTDEVSGTSSASPGLEITTTYDVDTEADPSNYTLAANDSGMGIIAVPEGAGQFPNGWQAGMDVTLNLPASVQFGKDQNGSYIDGIYDNIRYQKGDNITLTGDISADLQVIDTATVTSDNVEYYHFYLGDRNGNAINWIDDGNYRVNIAQQNVRWVIDSTDGKSGDDNSDDAGDTNIYQITVRRLIDGETDADWSGFDSRSVYNASVRLSDNRAQGGFTASIAACPENETTDTLEIDIFATQGLVLYNDKGKRRWVRVSFDIQYRDIAAGGDWTTVSETIQASSPDQFGQTYTINLPSKIRPEVRIRKTGSDVDGDEDGTKYDTIKWYGLKSKLDRPSSYPDVTSVAIQIRTGERLGAQAQNKIKFRQTRMLPPWDNSDGDLVATRDIAPVFMYMLSAAGYSNADIDTDELGRLHDVWQGRGDTFDMQFLEEKTLKDALNTALAVGFAELCIERGYIVPVRDEPRSVFGQAYTLNNMTSELKISTKIPYEGDSDQHDGVDVAYVSGVTGQKETVQCRLPGSEGIKVNQVTVDGISDRDKAYQYGMRVLLKEMYRNRTFSFSTGFDALNSPYLDYAAVNGDYERYGQSGQVVSYSVENGRAVLDTDQDLDWSGDSHTVALQRPDGSMSGPYEATQGDYSGQIIMDVPDFTPATDLSVDPARLLFGQTDRMMWKILIQKVSPQGAPQDEAEPECSVTASNYDERVYQYDDEPAPADT